MCDIVDKKCPKLRPYPSHELTEFLSEECSHPAQVISVERFSVDKCVHDPKLWVFDTKGFEYKNKPVSFGDPALKVFSLKNDTLVRGRTMPSYLYDQHNFGVVQVVVHVVDYETTCENTFVYLIDSTRGCLYVYSWKDDRFWRFDTPKFYGDAKYSDFTVATSSGKQVKYFPKTHIHEATVDLCHNKLLYHARGSLSAYAIDLDTVNNGNTSILGPTKFDVTYVGEKNKRGQTGSQAMNNELCTVWGIQEQNYAITCYNRQTSLTPEAVKIVVADSDRLSFLVDMKLEPEPKHCMREKKSVFEDFKRYYHHYVSKNWIYVLTNNEKGIESSHVDVTHENFGIYYIEEGAALKVYPQCLPHYKAEYQPPSIHKKPYKPVKTFDVPEQPQEQYLPVTPKQDLYDIPEPHNQLLKQYQPPPIRVPKQYYANDIMYGSRPHFKPIEDGYNENTYETHLNPYFSPSYDPYYSYHDNHRYKKSEERSRYDFKHSDEVGSDEN